jgi:DHA2 family multidrug resistance protein
MSGVLLRLAPASHHAAAPCPACTRPVVGLAAVLLGSVISTLFSRITSFGLADLRGAIGASFDEGAWITTAATVGQMCIGPIAAWLGVAFGPRRVLMISAGVFGLASALIPFSPNLTWVLVGQAVAGLSSGTFIPLTIGFVLQSMQPALWPFGIAAYGLNLELSLNVPASLEVHRPSVLALDLLARRTAVIADAVLHPSRHATPTHQPGCAAHRR